MKERKPPHRGVYILPNLFTTASLFSAFMCVTYSFEARFESAALAIFFSALMDGLDGKVARLTNTTSKFGIEYDSLADVVAFGMAPSILVWTWQLQDFGRLGIAISFLFVACAALRLARFNVDVNVVSKKFFIGLPSPAAGCMLAGFVLFVPFLPEFLEDYLEYITIGVSIMIPLLMVSRIRYFSFKEYGFVKAHPFRMLVGCMLVMVLLFSQPYFWFFTFGFIYLIIGILYSYVYLPHRNHQLLRRLKHLNDTNVQ